jgi:hypothetical protein
VKLRRRDYLWSSSDDITVRVIATKGFDVGDTILRTAIREQVGSTIERLHREGAVDRRGARKQVEIGRCLTDRVFQECKHHYGTRF